MEIHSAGILYVITKIHSYFMSIWHSKLHNNIIISYFKIFFMFCICELHVTVISNSAGVESDTKQQKNRIWLNAMLFIFKAPQNTS